MLYLHSPSSSCYTIIKYAVLRKTHSTQRNTHFASMHTNSFSRYKTSYMFRPSKRPLPGNSKEPNREEDTQLKCDRNLRRKLQSRIASRYFNQKCLHHNVIPNFAVLYILQLCTFPTRFFALTWWWPFRRPKHVVTGFISNTRICVHWRKIVYLRHVVHYAHGDAWAQELGSYWENTARTSLTTSCIILPSGNAW